MNISFENTLLFLKEPISRIWFTTLRLLPFYNPWQLHLRISIEFWELLSWIYLILSLMFYSKLSRYQFPNFIKRRTSHLNQIITYDCRPTSCSHPHPTWYKQWNIVKLGIKVNPHILRYSNPLSFVRRGLSCFWRKVRTRFYLILNKLYNW